MRVEGRGHATAPGLPLAGIVDVVQHAAPDLVVFEKRVVARTTVQIVVTGVTIDEIVAVPTPQRVVADAAVERVVSAQAGDAVVAAQSIELIRGI